MRDEIFEIASESVHMEDPRKRRVFEILRAKFLDSYETKRIEMSNLGNFDYLGYAMARHEWKKYISSLGMTSGGKDDVLDPSCYIEWEQSYIHVPEEIMEKILVMGLP